ncbi:MAG: phage holin family protein [Candidatus Limiplasma sp.]|nr:phage holin family protein [Candidatus Limiplasma sp.]
METTWDKIVKVLATIGGAIAGAFGGWNWLLVVLLSAMVADYVSGVTVAWMGRSLKTEYGGLSSKVGAVGLAKKGLMLMVVLIAALLDRALGNNTAMFRDAVCWFYIANEIISLMENMSLAGVKFPKKLQELLGQKLKESGGASGDETDKPSDGKSES